MRDDVRRKILARRAAFVAAAMAGAAVSCNRCNPLVCLEPAPVDAHTSADAGSDAALRGETDAAPEASK